MLDRPRRKSLECKMIEQQVAQQVALLGTIMEVEHGSLEDLSLYYYKQVVFRFHDF